MGRNKRIQTASDRVTETGIVEHASANRSSLRLSQIIDVRPRDELNMETNIIAVPGYCTPPVKWDVDSELRMAADSVNAVSRLNVYTHSPKYSGDEFSWESFLMAGGDLAEDLAILSTEYPHRPIIFIAHSLGGVLLKQALLLAKKNLQDPRFKTVVECLSGILFLGTPHCGSNDKDTLLRHNEVLYSCAKIAVQKKSAKLPSHDVYQLSNLAATFEQIADIPVLSVYEIAQIRSSVRQFLGSKRKTLVDEQLARISSNTERLLGVPLNHSELCKLPLLKDGSYSAREFLRTLLQTLDDDRHSITMVGASSTLPSPKLNPLNPLNLSAIEPDEDIQSSVLSWQDAQYSCLGARQSLPNLPTHLRLVSGLTNHRLESKSVRLPCFMLAQYGRNKDFIGRENILSVMDQTLLPRERDTVQDVQLFALCGMGGIGKTDLAIEYAYSRKDQFGAVLWVDAGGVSQLAADFGHIAAELGLETLDEAQDLGASKELAKAWLERSRNASTDSSGASQKDSWLLIFDNADSLGVIADYIPHRGGGSVLMTSRDPSAKTYYFSTGTGIDLEPLSSADGAKLLRKLITRTETPESADEESASITVAQELDGLPLAMTQMAGFIRKRHLSIREFVDIYANDSRYAEIHGVGNPSLDQRYGYTLATTFNFEGLGIPATNLVQMLAFMNPDRIRESIFQVSDQAKYQALAFWTDASSFEQARYDLIISSIIKRNIIRKELWIHRVIQAEVRARMDKKQRYERFKDAVALLASIWPPGNLSSQTSRRWELCEDLLPHLERFHQLYTENASSWESFDVDPTFPTLLNEAGIYLHERGFSHEGKAYVNLALALCKRANIVQQPLLGDLHLTMTALTNETNDPQSCLEHNILCLAMRKAEAEKNKRPDISLAFAHSQMGIAYMMIEKFAQATEHFKQCIEMLKGLHVDVDEFGFPVCNLGLAYWIQGQLDVADETLTELLMQRTKHELNHVSYKTGRVLQGLGNVKISKAKQCEEQNDILTAQNLWEEAFAIHQKMLQQYESTLGNFNHRTADACHKLAEHYIYRKEHDVAQSYLDRALSIWGNKPWFRNESARTSYLKGSHLKSLGDSSRTVEGQQWVDRAIELRREIVTEEEPRELETVDFDNLVCFWSI